MKTQRVMIHLTALLLIFGVATQGSFSAPVYIKNFSSFPAYPYNTAAYKQGGAFVGCGPTTGAMIMAYFHHVEGMSSTSGLLTNPGTGVDEGLNTAWTLHGSAYMNTGTDGFGSVYNIEPGLENYATSRGYTVDVMIHVSPTYDPSSTAWQAYGPYGTSWLNDGDFWTYSGGVWGIDANKFCDFVGAKLANGVTIFLTIDTDLDGSGDHWVALVGYDKSTLKYAFYDTYSTTLQWADIYYCGATPRKDNSISFVRSVTYKGPIQQNNPPRDLVALTGYHAAVPLAWNKPSGMTLLATSSEMKTSESMDDVNSTFAASQFRINGGILSAQDDFHSLEKSPALQDQSLLLAPTGYHVYRSTSSGGTYTRIASNITRQYYRDEAVANGTTYYYKVTAVYSSGESGFSNIVSATPTTNGYVINSKWTTTTPTLNGVINASEWSAASTVNILFPGAAGTVTLYVMNNSSTLFLAVDDKRDTHLNNTDQFAIFFDENLNREWPPSGSSDTEGNFWIALDSTSNSSYAVFGPRQGYWPDNLIWPPRSTPAGVSHGISISSGNMQYECSINLSSSPLNAVIGSTIGLLVFTYDYYPKYFNSFWPQQAERLKAITPDINYWGQAPFSFGNLQLAASASTPDISCNPLSGDFGSVTVGGYQEKTFTIKNDGTADLIVSATTITGTNASEFSIQSGGGAFTLAPAATRNLIVRFTPTTAGSKSASLSISSNDPDENPLLVALSGTGTTPTIPDIAVTPTSWSYGSVAVGSTSDKIFVVKNEGTANLSVTATTLTGTNAAEFSIPSGGGAFTLAPNAIREIVV
ncbi:MAG: choice-of-anchor D domain-containing protein, partial [candidate division KSB1 bacterium]|nr:choice-of-anchor D domain-containing protein [candidate division KSB1 bacterium]